jgi:hypothetical protein
MTPPPEPKMFADLKKDLSVQIGKLNWIRTVAFIVAFGVAVFVYLDIKSAIGAQVDIINEAKNSNQTLIFLMFRSPALGVIATTVLYTAARVTISSLDQSMRFVKRKFGVDFLEALFQKLEPKFQDKVEIKSVMQAFEIWNKNVESAFSSIKTERGSDAYAKSVKAISEKLPGTKES